MISGSLIFVRLISWMRIVGSRMFGVAGASGKTKLTTNGILLPEEKQVGDGNESYCKPFNKQLTIKLPRLTYISPRSPEPVVIEGLFLVHLVCNGMVFIVSCPSRGW